MADLNQGPPNWTSHPDVPWTPAPMRPRMLPGELHVWLVEREPVAEVLRTVLARYLDRPPTALRFTSAAGGKPQLEGPGPAFNLSHSGDLALVALVHGGEVGVDLELVSRRAPHDPAALAERAFGAEAAARLRSLDPTEARAELLRMWVRHEARLKCLGRGVLAPVGAVAQEPALADLELGEHGAFGAVAVLPSTPLELRCWRLG
jgi:phosphopantetheinyl transferase